MNETTMTIVGNVVDSPNLRRTKNGHTVANFRVGSTQRRFDRDKGEWVDGRTLFVTVTAWRALGENVAKTLAKGMPVIVHGRYYQRDYEKDEQLRVAYELEASAVGPDLTRGIATFERVVRSATPQFDTDENGAPHDVTGDYLDLDRSSDGDTNPIVVDPETGEVHELVPA